MEPKHHTIEKENHLPSLNFQVHVKFQGSKPSIGVIASSHWFCGFPISGRCDFL